MNYYATASITLMNGERESRLCRSFDKETARREIMKMTFDGVAVKSVRLREYTPRNYNENYDD